jgi:hypothetical protein
MKAIAGEVGIDPALVERAATSVGRGSESVADKLLGGPTKYGFEHTVEGALPEGGYSRIVDAIRRATDHHGEVGSELGSLSWRTVGEVSQVHVVVRPEGERTRIQVTADRGPASAMTLIFCVAGGLVGGGILGAIIEPSTVVGGAAILAGMGTGGLTLARTLWSRGSKRFNERFGALLEHVRGAVEAEAAGEGSASED